MQEFDRLREFVMGDGALIETLTRCGTEASLFSEVLTKGRAHDLTLEEEDLAEIVRANRRRWLERWTRQ